jgi:hypothetical protein
VSAGRRGRQDQVERAGDVDDLRLAGAEAAKDILGRVEDPLGREDILGHAEGALVRSLSSETIRGAW